MRYRLRAWKHELQQLAETRLTIHVSHFPGTSKWNKIERELSTYETVRSLGPKLNEGRWEEMDAIALVRDGFHACGRDLSGSGPILPRLHQCFEEIKVDFNKGSVGKLIRRDLVRCQSVDKLPPGVAKKGEALLTAVRAAFGTSGEQPVVAPIK